MTSTRKRSNLQAKRKHPRNSFENAGNQLICMDCANLPWQLKFYKQNSISRRHHCFLSNCLSWLRLRYYTACDWLNIPAVIFAGSCVKNLILYFPQIWLAIRYLDGGNDPFTCLNQTELIGNFEQSRNFREWILFKIIFQVTLPTNLKSKASRNPSSYSFYKQV